MAQNIFNYRYKSGQEWVLRMTSLNMKCRRRKIVFFVFNKSTPVLSKAQFLIFFLYFAAAVVFAVVVVVVVDDVFVAVFVFVVVAVLVVLVALIE